jgi:hypothetical protein
VARRRIDATKLGISIALVAAVALFVIGFSVARTGDDATPKITDPAVERLIPDQGALVLRQSQVGIDLAPGYRGVLVIDGQELPTTDLVAVDPAAGGVVPAAPLGAQFDPAQNTVLFTPREGAAIKAFVPGEHTVTAVFWKVDQSRDSARSYTWHFKVS